VKIVHVIRDLSIDSGGPVTALKGLAEAQVAEGHEVAILATDRGDLKATPAGVELVSVRAFGEAWAWAPGIHSSLARLIPEADIVHLHMVWDYPIWAAARSAQRHGTPFILRPCGQLDPWSMSQKALKKRLYLRVFGAPLSDAAAIHFTTPAERDHARPVTGTTPSLVIPIGVSVKASEDLPRRDAFSLRFPRLRGRRVVLFLGRLHRKKQPDLLIRAFAEVAKATKDLDLVLAGPGEDSYVDSLRAIAEECGIASRVTLTGVLHGRAIEEAYACAAVFVLPSRQENFGIAIVEAMAAGCPIVIAESLDLAAEIKREMAGITCATTEEGIATAITRILEDGPLGERLAANGRRFVAARYAWAPIARATIEAYEVIVRRQAMSPTGS
jgi:glycosyltransferase involved in cell wall biosynthesis